MSRANASGETGSITLTLSAAELAQLDAWAAAQSGRPTREQSALLLLRRALGLRIAPEGQGLRASELNAENDG